MTGDVGPRTWPRRRGKERPAERSVKADDLAGRPRDWIPRDAWVQWYRGEDDEARANMRIAARDGSSETAMTAEDLLAALAHEHKAEQLIDKLKSL